MTTRSARKREPKKTSRKAKVTTKTIVLEVETSAPVALLKNKRVWTTMLRLFSREAKLRQITIQVADRTK